MKIIIILLILAILLPYIYHYARHIIRGDRVAKKVKVKKKPLFLQLWLDMPKMIIDDDFNRKYGEFEEKGFHIICGEQGSGKTITTAYLLQEYAKMYPKIAIRTNMTYKYENGSIKNWTELVNIHNGIYGQIDVIDEVHNWFNSLESKNMPPEMFGEIAYLRKQRKMIIGTSQVFTRVAKGIREQSFLVYEPFTIKKCLTICPVYKPVFDDTGDVKRKKFRKLIIFVHTKELRESYDTYKKIKTMSLKGFKPFEQQLRSYTHAPTDTL